MKHEYKEREENHPDREIYPDHTMETHPHYGEIHNLNSMIKRGEQGYQILIKTPHGGNYTCENVTFVWGGSDTKGNPGRTLCVGTDTTTEKQVFVPCPPGTEIYKIKKPAQKQKYYD